MTCTWQRLCPLSQGFLMLKVWLIAAALCLATGCSGSQGAGSGVGPPQLNPDLPRVGSLGPEDQACSEDLDCTLVQDCCGCDAGGRLLAVRQDRVDELRGSADGSCSTQCAASSSRHRSCSASEAICRGGRCIPAIDQ